MIRCPAPRSDRHQIQEAILSFVPKTTASGGNRAVKARPCPSVRLTGRAVVFAYRNGLVRGRTFPADVENAPAAPTQG
jgi:hypothetical protein